MREQTKMMNVETPRAKTDWLFVLYAGGSALLAYSLVYALRKPFTAAAFEGYTFMGMDYKLAVSIVQLLGYVLAKFLGIKFISELKPSGRLRFIIGSAVLSEVSLLFFGLLPAPFNIVTLFFNGLSLGCMWGILFSFLEGRKVTDLLASMMGVSMAVSSGVAKSMGLFAMQTLHVSEFWMPALIGALALPLLSLMAWLLNRMPKPTAEDIASRTERTTLNGKQRMQLFRRFMPFLILIFGANLLLTVMRDVKEDFIVCIIDVNTISSWAFAQMDMLATFCMLALFGVLTFIKKHLHVLCLLLFLSALGMLTLAYIGVNYHSLQMSTLTWLFLQTFCIDIAYLSFQTIFFERFIACFRIRGNVGFFIITIDFIGYVGTLFLLLYKQFGSPHIDWLTFYNILNEYIGFFCIAAFTYGIIYLIIHHKKQKSGTMPTTPTSSVASKKYESLKTSTI